MLIQMETLLNKTRLYVNSSKQKRVQLKTSLNEYSTHKNYVSVHLRIVHVFSLCA